MNTTETPQEAGADHDTVTVRRDDLELLRKVCGCYAPYPWTDEIRDVMERIHATLGGSGGAVPDEDSRPAGIFGRVELPGYRQHTGWITEEPRFGQQMAVVRDWDGREIAMAALGPGCQVVVLPTPRKRPEAPKAITGGYGPGIAADIDGDEDDEDEDRAWGGPF